MKTRITLVSGAPNGACAMCGKPALLHDVEDDHGDSLLNDTGYLCYHCAEIAQEMILDEIRLEKTLEKENGNPNC